MFSLMGSAERFKEQIVARLRYLIELRRKSVTGVEKEMGRGRGYLGDALRGEKRLSLDMLLEVLDHLEIEPETFFAGRTPEERRWGDRYGFTDRLPAEVAESRAGDLFSSGGDAGADLGAVMEALVRLLESKGVLSVREIQATIQPARSPEIPPG